MIPDELFIWTIQDLDERLELGRGEYDAFCMAWLLRKLLLNGRRSLVDIVAAGRSAPLGFVVRDNGQVAENVYGWLPLAVPEESLGIKTLEVDHPSFLKHPIARVKELEGYPAGDAKPYDVTVERLIYFLANNLGAVHVSKPANAWEKAFWDYCWSASYSTRDGQYSGGVFCLIDVARVVRRALEPLRDEIVPDVWPEGLPDSARKIRRLRPPAWR